MVDAWWWLNRYHCPRDTEKLEENEGGSETGELKGKSPIFCLVPVLAIGDDDGFCCRRKAGTTPTRQLFRSVLGRSEARNYGEVGT